MPWRCVSRRRRLDGVDVKDDCRGDRGLSPDGTVRPSLPRSELTLLLTLIFSPERLRDDAGWADALESNRSARAAFSPPCPCPCAGVWACGNGGTCDWLEDVDRWCGRRMPGRIGGLRCPCSCDCEGSCCWDVGGEDKCTRAAVVPLELEPDPDRARRRSAESFLWSSTASGGYAASAAAPGT